MLGFEAPDERCRYEDVQECAYYAGVDEWIRVGAVRCGWRNTVSRLTGERGRVLREGTHQKGG